MDFSEKQKDIEELADGGSVTSVEMSGCRIFHFRGLSGPVVSYVADWLDMVR